MGAAFVSPRVPVLLGLPEASGLFAVPAGSLSPGGQGRPCHVALPIRLAWSSFPRGAPAILPHCGSPASVYLGRAPALRPARARDTGPVACHLPTRHGMGKLGRGGAGLLSPVASHRSSHVGSWLPSVGQAAAGRGSHSPVLSGPHSRAPLHLSRALPEQLSGPLGPSWPHLLEAER